MYLFRELDKLDQNSTAKCTENAFCFPSFIYIYISVTSVSHNAYSLSDFFLPLFINQGGKNVAFQHVLRILNMERSRC